MEVQASNIPAVLKERKQWVLWAEEVRDGKPTKVPYNRGGFRASSTDAGTWDTFESVLIKYEMGGYAGIGFVFSKDDPFCGIDLDGCYSKSAGMQSWATDVIRSLDTYGEWSPSGTGVKLIVEGHFPLEKGKNKKLDYPKVCDKSCGIEIYGSDRFFCITGRRGKSSHREPQPRQLQLEQLCMKYFGQELTIERAKKYLAAMEPAVSGSNGSRQTCKAVLAVVKGFGLADTSAMQVLREFNARCQPPWSDREIERRIHWAQKQGGAVGYLRDAKGEEYQKIPVQEIEYKTGVGDAIEVCLEAMSMLEASQRKVVLAAIQASVR